MPPQIRPAIPSDIPQILTLYKYYVDNTIVTFLIQEPAESYISTRLIASQSRGLPYLVAVDSSTSDIVGYASASAFRGFMLGYGHTVEMSIFVHPEKKNHGIGGALIQTLIQQLRETRHISHEDNHENEPVEFPVKNVLAVMAIDDQEAGGGLALRDWYVKKWGFEEVGHLKRVGFKDGRWLAFSTYFDHCYRYC
jgi:L-amino acid N-acyltransferase YncA